MKFSIRSLFWKKDRTTKLDSGKKISGENFWSWPKNWILWLRRLYLDHLNQLTVQRSNRIWIWNLDFKPGLNWKPWCACWWRSLAIGVLVLNTHIETSLGPNLPSSIPLEKWDWKIKINLQNKHDFDEDFKKARSRYVYVYRKTPYLVPGTTCVFLFFYDGSLWYQMQPKKGGFSTGLNTQKNIFLNFFLEFLGDFVPWY